MNQEVYDVRLQSFLKHKIKNSPVNVQIALKSIANCGAKVLVNAFGQSPGVFLMQSNLGNAKIWGTVSCKSAWACPVCTAKKMNSYSRDIACAIDALREQNLKATMITFTIPHFRFMSCETVTEILYNTWKMFMVHAPSSLSQKKVWRDVVYNFADDVKNIHRVRVTEYTYNKLFGWHPHFHCLFWVPAQNLQKISDWEPKLRARWNHCMLTQYKKYFEKHFPNFEFPPPYDEHKNIESLIQTCLTAQRKGTVHSQGVFVSRTETGKVREALTSDYICGWGADKEVTGNRSRKASSGNSMTPYQLLDSAKNGNEEHFNLFIEYAMATKKARHARVNFSVHSGIKKFIKLYKQTQAYQEHIKKKFIQGEKWSVLIWFPSELWSKICQIDSTEYIISKMLAIARRYDFMTAWDLIDKLLLKYDIDINFDNYYPEYEISVAEQIFNKTA